MASSVLGGQRKIYPAQQVPASMDEYALSFDLLGIPYSEPAMANLMPRDSRHRLPVHGVACLISQSDFERIVATEGAGVAYVTLCARARTISSEAQDIDVYTLVSRKPAARARCPSVRYLVRAPGSCSLLPLTVIQGLLVSGANDHNLPLAYQEMLVHQRTFQPSTSPRYRAGKWTFDMFWLRVQRLLQISIIKCRDEHGYLPRWFLIIFDTLLFTMWAYHDLVHAMLWGRGDGI